MSGPVMDVLFWIAVFVGLFFFLRRLQRNRVEPKEDDPRPPQDKDTDA